MDMEKNLPYVNISAHGVHEFVLKVAIHLSDEFELIPGKNEVFKTINQNANIRRLRIALKRRSPKNRIPHPKPLSLKFPLIGGNGHSVHVIVEIFEVQGPDYIMENTKLDLFFDLPNFREIESIERLDEYMANLSTDKEKYKIAERRLKELNKIVVERRELLDRRNGAANGNQTVENPILLEEIKVVKRLVTSTSMTYKSVDPNRCEPSEEPDTQAI